MDKEKDNKSTIFYIKQATMGQFFIELKKSLISLLWWCLFVIPVNIFFEDSRHADSLWGFPNYIWYLGAFAILSWIYRGKKFDFEIPRLVFIEWFFVNFIVTTLTFSFKFADKWFASFYFLLILFLLTLYLNLAWAGKCNLEKK